MESFSALLPFVRGIHRSPVNSPHKGQWRGALMISLVCVWINGWVNTREAGDLRRHRAHYDVTVMLWTVYVINCTYRWLRVRRQLRHRYHGDIYIYIYSIERHLKGISIQYIFCYFTKLYGRGIHRSPVDSLHKSQWRGALIFSLSCTWTNGWANNRDAGDLRRHHAHYGVTVMNAQCLASLGLSVWWNSPAGCFYAQRDGDKNNISMELHLQGQGVCQVSH